MGYKIMPARLRAARENLGITAAEAARRTGMDKSSYHKYEMGTASPADPTLRLLAMYLGTSVEYLCGLSDDPSPTVLPVSVDHGTADFIRSFTRLTTEEQRVVKELIRILADKE